MVEKNMKEEEESTLEERRAREQLGEGVEVRVLFLFDCFENWTYWANYDRSTLSFTKNSNPTAG